MKSILLVSMMVLISTTAMADQYVQGHWKDTDRDGVKDTYVDGYHRTERNNNTDDNYNSKGNSNPWTGEKGTVRQSDGNEYNGSLYNSPKKRRSGY